MNLNYTKRFPLRKRDGSLIELTDKKDTVYILLPESLTTVDISYLETYGNRIERLYIQDEQVGCCGFFFAGQYAGYSFPDVLCCI